MVGDVYVAPTPWFFDEEYRQKAWENYKEREKMGFPCDEYQQEIVQELKRCKDCRWWEHDYRSRYHPDERPCNSLGMGTMPDWYCANFERKKDEID